MSNDLSGRIIRGYEMLEQIGAGGFGAVYRASQPILKREVAIKVVLPEYANSPDFVRRFEVEAELVARLEHPYIVPLFDYWREPDSAYLVMRLLRGGTLQGLLEEGNPLPLERIATILDQITSALHVSHRNGVVHRDIKPANVLMDEDGNAFLTDFGIAQATDYESISSEDEGITGSISHTPPEQIQSGKITPQTDIYAVGIILYQMLAGEHPFKETTITQMIFKHLQDPIPDLDRDDIDYDINDILQKATAKDPQDRYEDVRELASEFRALALGSSAPVQIHEDILIFMDVDNPYKGLRAFQEADADQFFGRDDLIQRLLGRLSETEQEARFLAVIGPSGSGKSSVVKAGLLPKIRNGGLNHSENWFVVEMFPSSSPFRELESALMKVAVNPVESLIKQVEDERGLSAVINQILPDDGSELVLVIDQFEELFTQVEDENIRTRFLDNLVDSIQAENSRLRVIVTMRADFYDKPLQYREFGELLRKRIETVLPMSPEELEETITRPAQMVGIDFQPGLVDAISQDVGDQPGMLPLLQYTMTELFDNRQGHLLTLEAYQNLGGVTGSLARRSEEIYTGLFFDGQQATRQLFLRLVSLGEGTEDTRRRVRRSELVTSETIASVIDLYGRYRLLTFDKDPASREPTVEVAHEALIRTWERLRQWINENREDLRIQRRLSSAIGEWVGSGKDDSFLASGARLTQFQEWREQTDLVLNADERTYIETSIAAEEARKEKERAIARRVQNFQRASIVLGLMVVLAIVATGILLNQANRAQRSAEVAQNEAATAQSDADRVFSTLEPAQSAVFEAQSLAEGANTQVAIAQTEAEGAELAVAAAQEQATIAQQDLVVAQTQIGNAETQQAVVEQLTIVAPTIANADARVSELEEQVERVGATLTPAQATVAAAQAGAEVAQTDVAVAQREAEIAQTDVVAAQDEIAAAQSLVSAAQAEADIAQTDVAVALEEAQSAQSDAAVAQTSVGVALAEAQTAEAGANLAETDVAQSNETLTPVAATVIAGAAQLAQQQADLSTAQVLAGNAETQVAVVAALTQVAPTIAAADERVANLERTLTPVQSTIDAAQRQIDDVGLTLTPIQNAIVESENQAATAQAQADVVQRAADSIFLAVNAEQALDLGDYDLALALTFESLNLDPKQTRARRILNEVAFGTARMSFDDTRIGEISPDSTYFVVSEGNDLVVWNVASRQIIDRVSGHTAPILDVGFSRDMARMITGSQDATARIWDITGWRNGASAIESVVLEDHTGAVNVVAFGFNDSLPTVFTGSDDSRIIEWSVSNGSIVRQYTGNTWEVVDITFVGDGNNFFTTVDANGTSILLYWNVGSVNPAFSEPTLIFENFNDDATRAVLGGTNGRPVEVYNTTRRNSVRQFTQGINWGNESATAFDFSPAGAIAAMGLSASEGENRLVIVDIATGAIIQTFSGQATQRVDNLAFNPSGDLLLSANDNILNLWDVQSGTVLRTLAAHTDVITDIQWSQDGRFAISRSRDNNIRVWDVTGADEALRQIFPIDTSINRGKFPGFNSRGDRVVAGVWVSLFSWDVNTGVRQETVSTGDEIIGMIYSPVDSRAISVLANVALLWDLDAGSNGRLRTYGDEVAQFSGAAAYSPNGEFIVLDDATRILVYEIATGNRQTINKPRFENNLVVTSVSVSPDGRFVVASTGQRFQQEASAGDIIMWDAGSGELLYRFPVEHNRTINWVAFSADGNRVISASDDDTLILWNVAESGAELSRRFAGHSGDVNIGRFVPNNDTSERFILSASDDRTMILWDIDSAQPLRTFRGSPAAITGLNISADGSQMVTTYGRLDESRSEPVDGSAETLVYVWELTDTDDLIGWTVANRFIRPLTAAECDQFGISDCDAEFSLPQSNAEPAPQVVEVPTVAASSEDSSQTTESNASEAPQPTEVVVVDENSPTVVNIGGQGLNVRASDTTNASVVTTLGSGEEAVIIGRSNRDTRWYQIRLEGGQVGWVRGDIISIRGDVSSAPDVSPPVLAVQPQPTAVPSNTNNSTSGATVPNTTTSSTQSNLLITGIGFVPDPPQCLQDFTVQLNITNSGTEPTPADATVFVYSRHVATGGRGAESSTTVPVLNPGGNWVVSVTLNVSTFLAEEHEIVAQVDSSNTVAESNENDNFYTGRYVLGSGSC